MVVHKHTIYIAMDQIPLTKWKKLKKKKRKKYKQDILFVKNAKMKEMEINLLLIYIYKKNIYIQIYNIYKKYIF